MRIYFSRLLLSVNVSFLLISSLDRVADVMCTSLPETLPSLYEHYTSGGVKVGLVPTADGFMLNGKPFRVISGAIHYFRVHPDYWRDRLVKLRAAGVTTVET